MTEKKTLTFSLMDAPFENARTTTALRLIDIASLIGKGVTVYAVEADLQARGIAKTTLLTGIKTVDREGVLDLFENHDRIWHR